MVSFEKRKEETIGMLVFLLTASLTFGSLHFGGKEFIDFIKQSFFIIPYVIIASIMLLSSLAVIPFFLSFFKKENKIDLEKSGVSNDGMIIYRPKRK